MADQFELKAELRTDVGKGASRRLRRLEDQVPAIIYGAGKEALPISVLHKDLHKALEDEGFYSRIVKINAGTESDQVILKALQRHPAKDRILHADFLRVSMDQEITVRVPLHFTHEDICVGVKNQGGVISHIETEVEVSCLPAALPEFIEVDMTAVQMGQAIHQSNLVLPQGVQIAGAHGEDEVDPVIANVHAPRGGLTAEEEAEEAAAAEVAAGAAGAEGEEEAAPEEPSEEDGAGEEEE